MLSDEWRTRDAVENLTVISGHRSQRLNDVTIERVERRRSFIKVVKTRHPGKIFGRRVHRGAKDYVRVFCDQMLRRSTQEIRTRRSEADDRDAA